MRLLGTNGYIWKLYSTDRHYCKLLKSSTRLDIRIPRERQCIFNLIHPKNRRQRQTRPLPKSMIMQRVASKVEAGRHEKGPSSATAGQEYRQVSNNTNMVVAAGNRVEEITCSDSQKQHCLVVLEAITIFITDPSTLTLTSVG